MWKTLPYCRFSTSFRIACAGIFLALLLLPRGTAWSQVSLRGGYHSQMLGLSSGYNKFLKDRYGVKSLALTGLGYSVHYQPRGKSFALGLEMDNFKGGVKYKTLNSEKQENTLVLDQTLLLLSYYLRSFIIDFGYGSNKLTRNFYGYQDADIVTTNVANSVGQKEVSAKGTVMMAQLLYRTFGKKIALDFGGRYSISKHTIESSDARPAYNSVGVPTATDFDLGGLTLLGILTFTF